MSRRCVYFLAWALVVLALSESLVAAEADSEDDWVDPFDMLNYDRHSKSMMQSAGSRQEPEKNQNSLNVCLDSLQRCEKALTDKSNGSSVAGAAEGNGEDRKQQRERVSTDDVVTEHSVYMRRFVNILLNTAGMKRVSVERFSSRQFEVHISVTDEQLLLLRSFANNEGSVSLRSLDEVLSDILKPQSSWVPDHVYTVLDDFWRNVSLTQVGYTALTLLVPLTVVYMLLKGYSTLAIISRSLLVVFSVGFVVTYQKMHKVAEIRSYVYERHHSEVPEECRPPKHGMFHWLFGGSLKRDLDTCQKYYEAVLLDTSLHVSPHVVLSEMVALFIVHPVEMVADAIVKFSSTILGGLPFGTNWLVLMLCVVMSVALLVLACGFLSGGQASFLGLHVGFGSKRPTLQQSAVESPATTRRQRKDSERLAVTAPQVINLNISLARRWSLGRSEEALKRLSSMTMDLTSGGSSEDGVVIGRALDDKGVASGQALKDKSRTSGWELEDKSAASGRALEDKSAASGRALDDKSAAIGRSLKDKSVASGQALKDKSAARRQALKDKSAASGQALKDKSAVSGRVLEDKSAAGSTVSRVTDAGSGAYSGAGDCVPTLVQNAEVDNS